MNNRVCKLIKRVTIFKIPGSRNKFENPCYYIYMKTKQIIGVVEEEVSNNTLVELYKTMEKVIFHRFCIGKKTNLF
jgi:hypothetical protein